ncbi:MAG TPA: STAS/SEC14 domain-containing protein [Verrucomicrobiae bacterium]
MPITLKELNGGQILEVAVSGKLTDQDYQQFIPEFEHLAAQRGKFSMLFEMTQFYGWSAKAAWDDLKLGFKHRRDLERIAMVGEKKWQRWMTDFAKPFTAGEIRYFDKPEIAQARAWLEGGGETAKTAASHQSGSL